MRRPYVLPLLLAGLGSTLAAHDLFLKLADFTVRSNAAVTVTVLNGTFTVSENSIARARVADLSLVGPAGRERLDTAQLREVGTRTLIRTRTGDAGTYVMGLSIRPNQISLSGTEFNGYLKAEGLNRVLEARRQAGELERGVTERYAKHVKVIFQAGEARSAAFTTVLGYPVEIVPLRNPYELAPGDTLRLRLLANGAPVPAGVEVIAGGRTVAGARHAEQHLVTDASGLVAVRVGAAGTWYVKFIAMTRAGEPGLDYNSEWATLTFAVLPASRKAK